MSYSAAILLDTPQAFWRMNDAAGAASIADSSGNSRSATTGSGVTLGYSATSPFPHDSQTVSQHDGTDNARSAFTAGGVTDAFTAECWFNTDTIALGVPNHRIWFNGSDAATYCSISVQGGNPVVFGSVNIGGVQRTVAGTTALVTGRWYHVALVWDGTGGSLRIYLNGAQEGVAGTYAGASAGLASGTGYIGGYTTTGSTYMWSGKLAGIAYYASALTATQIAAHYADRLLYDYTSWSTDVTLDRIVLAEIQPAERLGAFTRDSTGQLPVFHSSINANGLTGSIVSTSNGGSQYADGLLVLRVLVEDGAAVSAVSVTLNGTTYSCTKAGGATRGNFKAEIWYLTSPVAGFSGTYEVTGPAAGVTVESSIWSNVDTSTPFGTVATNIIASSTPSLNVTATTSSYVIDAMIADSSVTATVGAGQTQDLNAVGAIATDRVVASHETGAATVAMSWTLSGVPGNLAQVGVAINGTSQAYYVSWANQAQTSVAKGGIYRRLDSVRISGTALTLRASVASTSANLGSYYYDSALQRLYVSTSSGFSPNTFAFVGAWFTIFLSSADPGFSDQPLYEPRLGGQIPQVGGEVAEEMFGATVFDSGTLKVANGDGVFDMLSRSWIWENKKVALKIGGSSLSYSDYATVATMRIITAQVDDLSLAVTVESMASILNRTIPARTFSAFDALAFGATSTTDGAIGTVGPNPIGTVEDCPLTRVGTEPLSRPLYMVSDRVYALSYSILVSALYAINDTTGERTKLTSATDYNYSVFGHLALTATTYATENGYSLRADLTDAAGDLRCGTVAHRILTLCGEDDANIDTAAFTQADADFTGTIGLFLNSQQSAAEIMRQLEQSAFMRVYVGSDGLWTCKVFDPLRATVGVLVDQDFVDWRADTIDQSAISEVRVGYGYNPSTGKYTQSTQTDSATQYGRETTDSHTINTYLRSEGDAADIAGKYVFLKQRVRAIIDASLTVMSLATVSPGDFVAVTRSRAPSPAGLYSSDVLMIRKLTVSLAPVIKVDVILDDMALVLRNVGAYADDTEIDWSTASATEKTTYNFYSDDDGYIDSSDVTTLDRRVYW